METKVVNEEEIAFFPWYGDSKIILGIKKR
jgi:hypothetical protein